MLTPEALIKVITTHESFAIAAWIVAGCSFILAELSSPGLFFFISFALGCFAAAGTSAVHPAFEVQATVALIVCLISFLVMSKFLRGKEDSSHAPTNFDALIHQNAVVTEAITPDAPGRVKVRGEEWVAEAAGTYPVGTHVRISAVRGNRLVIK